MAPIDPLREAELVPLRAFAQPYAVSRRQKFDTSHPHKSATQHGDEGAELCCRSRSRLISRLRLLRATQARVPWEMAHVVEAQQVCWKLQGQEAT